MNLYWASFRLYLIWFVIVHIAGFVVFKATNLSLSLLAEIVCILAIYFVAQPSVKRYQYFFYNHGYSAFRMFIAMALTHLVLFFLVCATVNFFTNA